MNYYTSEYLIVLAIVVLVFILRGRAKGKDKILPGKQISISGQQIQTSISVNTPLVCLLTDGTNYGEDFQEKTPPELPHTEGCECQLSSIRHHGREVFEGKKLKEIQTFPSDLGALEKDKARYYKYALIANHPEITEELRSDYETLMAQMNINQMFKDQVLNQIAKSHV